MSKLGHVNDALAFAELIPSLNTLLSGSVASSIMSTSSFVGTILSPFLTMTILINANEVGRRMYSYRCVAYTTTSWVFDLPNPTNSKKILSNLSSGAVVASESDIEKYKQEWKRVSASVQHKLNTSEEIKPEHLKMIFKAFSGDNPQVFCKNLLMQFEPKLTSTPLRVWKANYSILYPM